MRRLLFGAIVAMLVAVAVFSDQRPQRSAGVGGSDLSSPKLRPTGSALPSARAGPGAEVRRFLRAFLDYEVGARGTGIVKRIETGASKGFSRQLLAHRPRMPAGRGRAIPARLAVLHIRSPAGRSNLLLASGTARRPSGPEAFAFLFGLRGGRWLAIAPAE